MPRRRRDDQAKQLVSAALRSARPDVDADATLLAAMPSAVVAFKQLDLCRSGDRVCAADRVAQVSGLGAVHERGTCREAAIPHPARDPGTEPKRALGAQGAADRT